MPPHDFGDGVTNLLDASSHVMRMATRRRKKLVYAARCFVLASRNCTNSSLNEFGLFRRFLLFFFFQPLLLREPRSSCVREHILTNNLSSTSTSSAKQHVPLSSKTTGENTPHHTQCFGYFRHTRHTHLRRCRLDTRRRNQF